MTSAERLSEAGKNKAQADILTHMYSNQVGVNLGKGLADPYVPYLAISLGADAPQLGWLQAFINLFPAVMQVPWGKLSDFFRRRIPFLIVGGVMSFSLYFFMVGAINSWHLIIIVAVQLCIGSMMIPTWSALVGDVTTVSNRGSVMSKFFAVATLASVIGTLIGGALIPDVPQGETMSAVKRFGLPFFMAGFMGIFGSAILYEIMEQKRRMYASPTTLFKFSLKSFVFISDLKENLYFRNLVVLNTFFNFIMSIVWPILYLTYVDVLHANAFEIGIITVTSTGATLFFQTRVGKLLDLIGPMPQILISRFAFISVPIVYALATEVWHIYALNIALGFASAMANVAFFAYIMDVAPEEKRGEYFAVYNTLIGIATFFGSVIGGYLALLFQNYYVGELVVALGAVYAISAIGRAAGAIWFLRLKDPVKYPETLRGVLKKGFHRWRLSRRS
jgi:DHA1 family multidrug resistance protein-like MFS transporter